MENKDIILFILVIIVIYLLYCNNNKYKKLEEKFSETTSSVSTTSVPVTPVDREIKDKIDKYLAERKDIPISESIKNLGILAKRLQEGQFLTVPGDFVIDGNLKVTGNINTGESITLTKNINGVNKTTTLSIEESQITPELNSHQKNDSHSLNVDSSIKFTNINSNGLRFPNRGASQSAIYQIPEYGNLYIHSTNGKINMPNQVIIELGGIEKLKFITPAYDLKTGWDADEWRSYIIGALNRPSALVFLKSSAHRNAAPYIVSTTKNQDALYQSTW